MTNQISSEQRNRLLRWASTASIIVALVLVLTKIIAWWLSDSVSLLASLIDSLMDVGASMINFFAIRYALKPADDDHRFGHGKAEALASLMQSFLIAASACFLMFYAIERIAHPRDLTQESIALSVMAFSLVLTLSLVAFQRYVVSKTKSSAIAADSLHYVSDILSNVAIIAALVLSVYGYVEADAYIGIAIALYIAYSAYHIAREASDLLLDKELDEGVREQIGEAVMSVDGVYGYHDLRTRQSGGATFIQLHLELPDNMPLIEAHSIADRVEKRVKALFAEAEVLVHQDPKSIAPTEHD
ncbi:MAG: cation diffusion facilitator family transporter [Gammaproteobacteria bacterium]|jgi:ferrous-iron efflux pump FieF|nr:cation diffusion facilitator family transporter [Gammaproteobacteria bacterium]